MSRPSCANNQRLQPSKMDPRVSLFKAAFDHQSGAGFDFPVFAGRNQFGHGFSFPVYAGRNQYGQGFGDVLRGIWRFFRPVAMKGAQTLLKAGSEAIKEGATVKDVLSATLKPTIETVLGATAEQVASRLTEKPTAAPPPGAPAERLETVPEVTDEPQKGSGRYRPRKCMHVAVYKSRAPPVKRISIKSTPRPIIYNL